MELEIEKDSTGYNRIMYVARHLIIVAALVFINVAFGWFGWLPATLGAIAGCTIIAFGTFGRGSWGDQLKITPEFIITTKGESEKFRIKIGNITDSEIRASAIVIAWQESNQKKSIIFGRECFSNDNWERLCLSLSSLTTNNTGTLLDSSDDRP